MKQELQRLGILIPDSETLTLFYRSGCSQLEALCYIEMMNDVHWGER